MISHRFSFNSDVATLFLGAGASVKLVSASKELVLSMEAFFDTELDSETLLVSVLIPSLPSGSSKFRTYRVSPRPLGNAVSFLNAAFLARFLEETTDRKSVIQSVRLAFGAFGGKHAARAYSVEKYLEGKCITPLVILEAVKLLKGDIVVKKGTSKTSYRESLRSAFLYK